MPFYRTRVKERMHTDGVFNDRLFPPPEETANTHRRKDSQNLSENLCKGENASRGRGSYM